VALLYGVLGAFFLDTRCAFTSAGSGCTALVAGIQMLLLVWTFLPRPGRQQTLPLYQQYTTVSASANMSREALMDPIPDNIIWEFPVTASLISLFYWEISIFQKIDYFFWKKWDCQILFFHGIFIFLKASLGTMFFQGILIFPRGNKLISLGKIRIH
jgi:hypothetical protein